MNYSTYPRNPMDPSKNIDYPDLEAGSGNLYNADAYTASIEKSNYRFFLRKIYSILIYQLAITVAMTAGAMYNENIKNYVLTHTGPLIAGTVFSFVFLIALFCYKDHHPTNMILLTLFTICVSYTVAVTCAVYTSQGYEKLVIKAFLITILTFTVLTVFTFQSKYDFDFLGQWVMAGLFVLIFWGILNWIMGSDGGIGYAIAGIMIFVATIIYDTHRLKKEYGYDDYILAAVTLYLDIINLFLYILDLLKKLDS